MRRWLVPLLVSVLSCAAFWSAADGAFVNLDDDQNFVLNQGFRGLDGEHLGWMLATGHMGHWQPLSWLTFALDYERAGLDAPRWHVTSILLHGLAALAVYTLALAALARARPGSAPALRQLAAVLAALLFAVHPLRAESVAWITGRNDIVAGAFLALAAAAWLGTERAAPRTLRARPAEAAATLAAAALVLFFATVRFGERGFLELRGLGAIGVLLALGSLAGCAFLVPRALGLERGRALYLAACAAVLLSLGGKAYAIVAPALFLVLDVWPLRRWSERSRRQLGLLAFEKLPLVALSIAAGTVAYWAKSTAVDSMRSLAEHSPLKRAGQAFFGLAWYLRKTLAPSGLVPMVDLPARISLAEPRFLLPLAAVSLLTALLVRWRARAPAPLAAWCCYVVLALPILGLTQSGAQLVADRYSYVACAPFALLAAGGWMLLVERGGAARVAASAGAVLVVLALGAGTWRQSALWRDSETLYAHAIAVNGSPRMLTNLAMVHNERALADPERRDEELAVALELSREALRVAEARGLLAPQMRMHEGLVLMNLGRDREALEALDGYVRQVPDDAHGLANLGLVLCRLGGFAQAVGPLERAVAIAPGDEQAWRYLGLAYEGVERREAAVAAYGRALELAPGQPMAAARLEALRGEGAR